MTVGQQSGSRWRLWIQELASKLSRRLVVDTAALTKISDEINQLAIELDDLEVRRRLIQDYATALLSFHIPAIRTGGDQPKNAASTLGIPSPEDEIWTEVGHLLAELYSIEALIEAKGSIFTAAVRIRRWIRTFISSNRSDHFSIFITQRQWYLHHSAHPPDSCPSSGVSSVGVCISPAL